MKSTRFWIILIAALLALSAAAALLVSGRTEGAVAVVYQDGVALRAIDLTQVAEGFSFTVDGPAGGNTIQVERGRIRVSHAGCPDQVCLGQGWISTAAAPIVCLPNRLVIQLEAAGEADIDGVTG